MHSYLRDLCSKLLRAIQQVSRQNAVQAMTECEMRPRAEGQPPDQDSTQWDHLTPIAFFNLSTFCSIHTMKAEVAALSSCPRMRLSLPLVILEHIVGGKGTGHHNSLAHPIILFVLGLRADLGFYSFMWFFLD